MPPRPPQRRRQRNSEPGRPGAAGPALRTLARSSERSGGGGSRARPRPLRVGGLGAGVDRPPRQPPAPGPWTRTLRVFGDPGAPGPAPSLPAPPLHLGAAFRLVAPESGGAGACPGAREPRRLGPSPEAGSKVPGRRAAARAGTGRGAPAGSLPPRNLEKGACPRRAPARGRTRRVVALGITPHAPGPRPPARVGDAAKWPSPSSPFPRPQTPAPRGPQWSRP